MRGIKKATKYRLVIHNTTKGTNWVCCFIKRNFDSSGCPPPSILSHNIRKNR